MHSSLAIQSHNLPLAIKRRPCIRQEAFHLVIICIVYAMLKVSRIINKTYSKFVHKLVCI